MGTGKDAEVRRAPFVGLNCPRKFLWPIAFSSSEIEPISAAISSLRICLERIGAFSIYCVFPIIGTRCLNLRRIVESVCFVLRLVFGFFYLRMLTTASQQAVLLVGGRGGVRTDTFGWT